MAKRNQNTRNTRRERQRREQRGQPAATVSFAERIAKTLFAAHSQPDERWRLVPYLLLAAFAVRAAVALWGDFVLHPDEIMQYLEPAHYAAFGNGVLYWEYIHGARSWLIPGAVAGVLKALDAIGLAQPSVYIAVVKLLFCLLSLLIPWAMYRFTRITVNEQAARVALLFGCFWYELVALAHKPFTEFVSAAVLMTALALSVGARNANARIPYLNALYLNPLYFSMFSVGLLAALSGAIRLQYAPLALALLLLRSVPLRAGGRVTLWAGALLVTVLVGILEWRTWGAPFHSYLTNFFFNIALDEMRTGESSRWLLLGQLAAASGGGAVIAFAATVGNIRRRPLILLFSALLLALHLLPEHREYRFLYLLIPCWLILLASFIGGDFGGSGSDKAGKTALARRGAVVTVLAFGALAILNIFPWQNWVYKSFSVEKGTVQYLRNQDPMFEAMNFLARQDDVYGVLFHADNAPYFSTGGYYYLHHDIPFYDAHTWNEAKRQRPGTPLESLVSHLVAGADIEQIEHFEVLRRYDDLAIWRRSDNSQPVVNWRTHVVRNTSQGQNDLVAKSIRRVRAMPLLGAFVVDCPPGTPDAECLYWEKAPPSITLSEE